jgi:hypothetical protein
LVKEAKTMILLFLILADFVATTVGALFGALAGVVFGLWCKRPGMGAIVGAFSGIVVGAVGGAVWLYFMLPKC